MLKNKKTVCILLVFILLLALAPSSFASEEMHVLHPSIDTDNPLEEIKAVVSDNNIRITGKGIKEVDQDINAYTITIDMDKKEYTAKKVSPEELAEIKMSLEQELADDTNVLNSQNYSGGVIIKTVDPPGIELCETRQKLWWSVDGIYSNYVTRDKRAWAANPSPKPFSTHWFVNVDKFLNISYLDGGRTIQSSCWGTFYNYDFLSNNRRTDVYHYLTLEGRNSGKLEYYWDWEATGEASTLLMPLIATY